jgi:undecaprenyl-diphosphatase
MNALLSAARDADTRLLLKINRDWACSFLSSFLPVLTDLNRVKWFEFGVAPAAVAWWLWKGGRKALKVLIVAAISVAGADQLAHRALKPWVARPRPPRSIVIERAPANGAYGFPSNHAANMAAAASVLSIAYPAGTVLFAAVAGLVGYSRVYVGAHYPGDVLGGFLLGVLVGWPWASLMLGGGSGAGGKKKKRKSG